MSEPRVTGYWDREGPAPGEPRAGGAQDRLTRAGLAAFELHNDWVRGKIPGFPDDDSELLRRQVEAERRILDAP